MHISRLIRRSLEKIRQEIATEEDEPLPGTAPQPGRTSPPGRAASGRHAR